MFFWWVEKILPSLDFQTSGDKLRNACYSEAKTKLLFQAAEKLMFKKFTIISYFFLSFCYQWLLCYFVNIGHKCYNWRDWP